MGNLKQLNENNVNIYPITHEDVVIDNQGVSLGHKFKSHMNKYHEVNHYDKNVIICVAGQSNAVGYDESPWDENFSYRCLDNSRIKQLGFKGSNNLKLVDLGACAENFQDLTTVNTTTNGKKGTKGMHLPLANALLDKIPKDYGVIILPCAYGGTGFTSGSEGTYNESTMTPLNCMRWGVTSPLFKAMRDRVKYSLDLNPENLFLGVIWCQGENDMRNAPSHLAGFQGMTDEFFRFFNDGGYGGRVKKNVWNKDIWFNLETVNYWYSQYSCQQIWNNYKAWSPSTYIDIPRATESNEIGGTGHTSSNRASHFGNDSYVKVIAPLIINKLVRTNSLFTTEVI